MRQSRQPSKNDRQIVETGQGEISQDLISFDSTTTLVENVPSFEQFQQTHPSFEWIQNQKSGLKNQYARAKSLGESANQLRIDMKKLKESMSTGAEMDERTREEQKNRLHGMMNDYKTQYGALKELKVEIEHVQHLLEMAKQRIIKDYDHYCACFCGESERSRTTIMPKRNEQDVPRPQSKQMMKPLSGERRRVAEVLPQTLKETGSLRDFKDIRMESKVIFLCIDIYGMLSTENAHLLIDVQLPPSTSDKKPNVSNDIDAFYKARDALFHSFQ